MLDGLLSPEHRATQIDVDQSPKLLDRLPLDTDCVLGHAGIGDEEAERAKRLGCAAKTDRATNPTRPIRHDGNLIVSGAKTCSEILTYRYIFYKLILAIQHIFAKDE